MKKLLKFLLRFLLISLSVNSLYAQGPGNVSDNLKLWLKADAGVGGTQPVTSWNDQSGNNFIATATAGPDRIDDALNFNPTLQFRSADREFLTIPGGIFGNDNLTTTWIYLVTRSNNIQTNTILSEELSGSFDRFNIRNPWSDGRTYYQMGSGGFSETISGGLLNRYDLGDYNMWTFGFHSSSFNGNTPNDTKKAVSIDGEVVLSDNLQGFGTRGASQDFFVGGRYNGADDFYLDGEIAEIIIYTDIPSILDQEKIHSYLALKYGIEKKSPDNPRSAQDERDFFDSNGNVIWDYSVNVGNSHNIAGIGRDGQSGLNQRKSHSLEDQSITIEKVGLFPSDRDFLLWGSDQATLTSTDVPTGYQVRTNRTWKVQTSGTPGLVNISINLGEAFLQNTGDVTDYALLIDDDGIFSSGASVHTTGASLVGDILSFTNVSFSNLDFFAVAMDNFEAPFFSNLRLWLRADQGVQGTPQVTQWRDQSGNQLHAGGDSGPDLMDSEINYQPVLDFVKAEQDFLEVEQGILGTDPIDDIWTYYVARSEMESTLFREILNGGTYHVFHGETNEDLHFYFGNSGFAGTGPGALLGDASFELGESALWTMSSSTVPNNPNGSNKAILKNGGIEVFNNNNDHPVTGNASEFLLGSNDTFAGYFDGQIAELLVQVGRPTAQEQEIIQSYLALKYGLTKVSADNTSTSIDERDYFSSDGDVTWSYSENPTFSQGIIGIGRDDNLTLLQKQSHLADDSVRVYLAELASGNNANTGDFLTDKEFLVLGNNGAALHGIAGDNNLPSGIFSKIQRTFKATNTDFSGTFSVDLKLAEAANSSLVNVSDLRLIVDTDDNFNDAVIYADTDGITFSIDQGVITIDGIDNTLIPQNTTSYLALASASANTPLFRQSPGNESENLVLWLRADRGVIGDSEVTSWLDQSTSAKVATTTSGPEKISDFINFNPVLDFNSDNREFLQIPEGLLGSSSYQSIWIYHVSKADAVQTNTIFSERITSTISLSARNPWSDGIAYYQFGNTNVSQGTLTTPLTQVGEFNFWTMGFDRARNTPSNQRKNIYKDGQLIRTNSTIFNVLTGDNQPFNIGGRHNNSNGFYLDGQIAELLVYTSPPSALEQEKIHSYLAIKYGIKKQSTNNTFTPEDERDYFDSSENVIWDFSANQDYSTIAGIGRDDNSGLEQRMSIAAGGALTVVAESPFTNDLSFLLWGNNGQPSTNQDAPDGYDFRLAQIWRAEVNGTVGTVSLSFDLSQLDLKNTGVAADYALLIDGDEVFADASSIITEGVSLESNVITFTGVTLTDNSFFSVALTGVPSPGDVEGLMVWFKADAGVQGLGSATGWLDQGAGGLLATSSQGPEILSGGANYNPALNFNRTADHLMEVSGGIFGTTAHEDLWVYYVAKADQQVSGTIVNENLAGVNEFASVVGPFSDGSTKFSFGEDNFNSGNGFVQGDGNNVLNNFEMWTFGTSSGLTTPNGTRKVMGKNGSVFAANDLLDTSITGAGNNFLIGGEYREISGSYYDGQIAEILMFSKVPSPLDQEKVQSYLSIKYGITKKSEDNLTTTEDERDYFSGAGNVLWDYSQNVGYTDEVIVIGRDDVSQLLQKQTRQVDDSLRIYLDNLSAENISNKGVFPNDEQFVIIGANGDVVFSTVAANSEMPSGLFSRIEREFKVTNFNFDGTFSIDIRLAAGANPQLVVAEDLRLLIDEDGDFSNATITDDEEVVYSVDNGVVTISGISTDLIPTNSTRYITLGSSEISTPLFLQAPGNASSNMLLWLRADLGITGTSNVSQWLDISGHNNHATASDGPTLLYNQFNFNPVLHFDRDQQDFMEISEGLLGDGLHTDSWVYVVFQPETTGPNTIFNESSTSNSHFALRLPWSDSRYYFTLGRNNVLTSFFTNSAEFGAPSMWTFGQSNEATPDNTRRSALVNGELVFSANLNISTLAGSNEPFYIGGRYGGIDGNYLDGKIAELIILDEVPSALEQEQIQSYLSIKYGLTKRSEDEPTTLSEDERDYFASAGEVIWDHSLNGTFSNEVTGIGRDDVSGLNQMKSRNTSQESMVTVEKVDLFDNDKVFLLWGNDGQSSISDDVPAAFDGRLARTWKVQETGEVGTVNISLDLSSAGLLNTGVATDYAMLVDRDGIFESGSIVYSNNAILTGDSLTFTNVNLMDGDFFSFASRDILAPGQVSNQLRLWLRADEGVVGSSPVVSWADQSSDAYLATSTNGPDRMESQINYNPALDFNGADSEILEIEDGILGTSSYESAWVYFVSRSDLLQTNAVFNERLDGSSRTFAAMTPFQDGDAYFIFGFIGGGGTLSGDASDNLGDYSLWTMGTASDFNTPNGTAKAIARDGQVVLSNNNIDPNLAGDNEDFYVGGRYFGLNNNYMDGQIAELIVYTDVPTPLEQEKVQSYLSLKYGISKSSIDNASTPSQDERDYFSSVGDVIWDYSLSTIYNSGVIGIGRDDASNLLQKQSRTKDDSLKIYISNLALSNHDNIGDFASDQSFLMIGHDNGSMCNTQGSQAEKPIAAFSRLDREIKVTNTNFSGTFSIEMQLSDCAVGDQNAADLLLLVDDDGNFEDALHYDHTSGVDFSVSGGRVTISQISTTQVPINQTSFITLGSSNFETPLPIELISFDALVTEQSKVQLLWETASETDNDFFTIERSNDLTDWSEVTRINGAGNSSTPISYSTVDEAPFTGDSYYRLKQTDFDGQFEYSDARFVSLRDKLPQKMVLFPNPAADRIRIEAEGINIGDLEFYNALGQSFKSIISVIDEGSNYVELDLSLLKQGVYLISDGVSPIRFHKR